MEVVVRIEAGKICVYTHSIDGAVFYVGKGVSYRPFEVSRHNSTWVKLVKDAGGVFDVDILGWFANDRDARVRETEEIKSRKPSANMMNNGFHRSDSFKAMMTARHTGKRISKETRDKISAKRLGSTGWNKGVPVTEEHREKLRNSASKQPIVDCDTGMEYESVSATCRELGLHKGDTLKQLNGIAKRYER